MKRILGVLFLSIFVSVIAPPVDAAAEETCGRCVQNIDPDPMGGSGTCPKAEDYNTCIKRCDCQYAENRKKCGTSPLCLDVATSERNACYGNCLTDYAGFFSGNPFGTYRDQVSAELASLRIRSPRAVS